MVAREAEPCWMRRRCVATTRIRTQSSGSPRYRPTRTPEILVRLLVLGRPWCPTKIPSCSHGPLCVVSCAALVLGAAGRFNHGSSLKEGTGAFAGFLGGETLADFDFTARAVALDEDSGATVEGARVELETEDGRTIVAGVSDENGCCNLVVRNARHSLSTMLGEYWREVPVRVTAFHDGYKSHCGVMIREDSTDVDVLIVMDNDDKVY